MSTYLLEKEDALSALPNAADAIMALDHDYVMGTYARQPSYFQARGNRRAHQFAARRQQCKTLSGAAGASGPRAA